jgi:hypothetical protein
MRTTVAFNGSYFNTSLMVKQYYRNVHHSPTPSEHPQGVGAGIGGLKD